MRWLAAGCVIGLVVSISSCLIEPALEPALEPQPETITGRVVGADRNGVEGALVRLVFLADDGVVTDVGISTITDTDGAFRLDVATALLSGFVVEAQLQSGSARSPALLDGDPVDVHAATDAMVQVISRVAAAGQSWAKLDQATLRELHDAVTDGIPDGLDLGDRDAVINWVRAAIGDRLAEAFVGEVSAVSSASRLGPNEGTAGPIFADLPAPPPGSTCNRRNLPLRGATFTFDLLDNGAVCDGNNGNQADAFDVAFTLRLRGDTFAGGSEMFPSQTSASIEDSNEAVFGPVTTASGLEVTRKVYVTPTDDVARYLEIVRNPTGGAIQLSLEIGGDLGSDESTLLFLTESGAPRVASPDRYAATLETVEFDPTIGYLWDGFGGDTVDFLHFPPEASGGFQYAWEDVSVPAGGLVVLAHFVLLSTLRDHQALADRLSALLGRPPLDGLSATEVGALANFHLTSLANVVGAAGAVAPGLLIAVRNASSGEEVATVAGEDGSFAVFISADAGDDIVVRSVTGGERVVRTEP